mgnify:CR=1 FL=1
MKTQGLHNQLVEWRHDLHMHPQISFEEEYASNKVANLLKDFGIEVHQGIAKTGVVGVLKKGTSNKSIGIRADMDALPINEINTFSYKSTIENRMHACGHDGHTTMLLGAAKHLAKTRNFNGIVVLIFQPAEEGLGGARGMLADGLFEQFPCDEIYGMHNSPNGKPGKVSICKGTAMAGAAFFDITVQGKGSHAAMPHQSRDPLIIASDLVGSMQTILSRNVPPLDACVLSVTQIHSGSAYNVVPDTASMAGTIRYFKQDVCDLAEERMRELCAGFATAYGVEIKVDVSNTFDVLMNDPTLSNAYLEAAEDIVGKENISDTEQPATGSADFADMLKVVPGAYCRIGHSGTTGLHNPSFFLDPSILPVGASVMARIAERRLSE